MLNKKVIINALKILQVKIKRETDIEEERERESGTPTASGIKGS